MGGGARRVLGTHVTALAPAADGEGIALLSDLHISPDTPRVREALAAALLRARGEGIRRAVILGDLFEFWVGPRQAKLPGFSEVLDVLRAASRGGMDVSVLRGNRDFMLERRFGEAAGVRVLAGGAELASGGRRFLLIHGDETCLNDVPHQRTRPWLRSWLVRRILLSLPLKAALRLAGAARRVSRRNAVGMVPDHLPVREAVEACFASGFDGVILGHIHRAAAGTLGGVGAYWILPAFDATGVWAVLADGRVAFRNAEGRPIAPPPELEFPALRRHTSRRA